MSGYSGLSFFEVALAEFLDIVSAVYLEDADGIIVNLWGILDKDEYAFTKGKMSFIAQDFNNLNIITVLEGRTQAIIRNHFLRYDRAVRCRVKIITMDMFSPYYDLAKQLRFQISRLRLKQSPKLFHSRMLKSFLIAFTLYNILAVL
ncbi:transposase [Streptococcus pneumoniae]|nr:transposase [Streptococcus pneumoniae]